MAKVLKLGHEWPARVVIAGIVMSAMLLTAILLIGISWFGSQQALRHVANYKAHAAAQITAERMRRMITPAENILRSLAFDPIAADANMPERLERLAALGVKLRATPLVSMVYIGYDNGDFLAIRLLDTKSLRQIYQAPQGAAYLVQTIDRTPGQPPIGVFFFYDAGYRLVTRRTVADYQIDPRVRPWYTLVTRQKSIEITRPYVFYSSRRVGISLARRAHNAQSVVGLDITLAGLSKNLGQLPVPAGSKLALVNNRGDVIGSETGLSVLRQRRSTKAVKLPKLMDLNVASLSYLWNAGVDSQVISYQADGTKWLGITVPFHGFERLGLSLLVTIPARGLLGSLVHNRLVMVGATILLLLIFLPFGWWVGRRTGMAMEAMVHQAHRLSHFDFSKPIAQRPPLLREERMLRGVMGDVSDTMESLLCISNILGAEHQIDTMLEQVLERLVSATRCKSGAVYLCSSTRDELTAAAGVGDQTIIESWVNNQFNSQAHDDTELACSKFDLRGRRGQLDGWLVLLHARDQEHSSLEFLAFANRLTGMLAVAIETHHLTESQVQLFSALVRVLADAIDAKSPYTGGHCTRVPEIAMMLSDRMEAEDTGVYADFALDDDERRSFQLAAWLHDAGKITSPESVVDKATKLETIYNRIHEIRTRFEVLWRDADIACLEAQLDGQARVTAEAQRDASRAKLRDDFDFIAQCNIGGESMDDAVVERLERLAATTWLRHFDNRLGLSSAEMHRFEACCPEPVDLPATEHLLADSAEHLIPWGDSHKPAVEPDDPRNTLGFNMTLPTYRQNLGELHNLSIRGGTLAAEDRYLINDHVVQTLLILKKLPWPDHLQHVPELAATHHERMDGKGYPRRLAADSLSTQDRILAVADVFEALTAPDRPYKSAKTISASLRIMAMMCREGHLDPELYIYFLRKRVWETYALSFINPAQIDEVDIEALAELASTTV